MKQIKYILFGIIGLITTTHLAIGGIYTTMVLNFTPSPAACQDFLTSGAFYVAVNPGLPDSKTGGPSQAHVTTDWTVALININPGVTTLVPALREDVYCAARCSLSNQTCWKACPFVVRNFYRVQIPTYAMPRGTIMVQCPTLTMSRPPY